MTTLQLYLGKSIILKAVSAFLVAMALLSMVRSLIVAKILIRLNADANTYFALLFHFLPHYIGYAAPLSLYAGTFETFRKLGADREITIMGAIGLGRWSILFPSLTIAGAMSAYLIFILGWVDPSARYEYRKALSQAGENDVRRFMDANTFAKLGDKTVLVADMDSSRQVFHGVFLFSDSGGRRLSILAQSAKLSEDEGTKVLTLENGTWLETSGLAPHDVIENTDFESINLTVAEAPAPFRGIGEDEQELNLIALARLAQTPPAGTSILEMKSEFYRKLGIILSPLILACAGVGFGLWASASPSPLRGVAGFGCVLAYHQINELTEAICNDLSLEPWMLFSIVASCASCLAVTFCYVSLTPLAVASWPRAFPWRRRSA